jgi:excisionase family DNA binding protein
VADYLKVSKPTVYKLARAGEIPAVRLGGTWRFSRSLLDEWLDRQMRGNKERISVVMKALKATAIRHRAIVVAVATADEQSLRRQRVHLENLWGPSLMQYQPDTALILNRGSASAFGEGATMIRCGLEKQRNGPQGVEFEFALHGAHFCFDPQGQLVEAGESFQQERVALRESKKES